MSFPAVLERGDEFLSQYPRNSKLWNYFSQATCLFAVISSKAIANLLYNPMVVGLDKLDLALARSEAENRGLITVMNHMSTCDDPFLWGCLPLKYFKDIDTIRWGLAAHNVCFTSPGLSYFFSLGKILSTERFGCGPFQGSIDAGIRLLCPEGTFQEQFVPDPPASPSLLRRLLAHTRIRKLDPIPVIDPQTHFYRPDTLPFRRSKPSWIHVFPEAFVLQLEPPHNNSMRYFHWGVSRMILEPTRAPIVLPIFSHGFEKLVPEKDENTPAPEHWIDRIFPNRGAEIRITIGDPIDDKVIEKYRAEWRRLCQEKYDRENPRDLSTYLKVGSVVQGLRSQVMADVRAHVAGVRASLGYFKPEDPRLGSPEFWKRFTLSEGASDPDIKFIGKNWAIRRLQAHLEESELMAKVGGV
ncbi:hypothetical protein BABINDRAFT_171568 [Babjeviella inositovora NRRL Y-12698]|uniref:Tafazzin family protein n=1 Tax=Babjeviella inositovora NRRL Y-12698 TaxID=984486 RepID=A0A1E3QQT3_9ASCO|nr:uncharacterized protein BABINDRAFT_171568 [Babjeviella inositovora NRRL Y-12698]ODQ80053.1 hypothetical protein BABINDRAFT_171568 [Babjeviella inositovora NRRL Y-12698]